MIIFSLEGKRPSVLKRSSATVGQWDQRTFSTRACECNASGLYHAYSPPNTISSPPHLYIVINYYQYDVLVFLLNFHYIYKDTTL